MAPDPGPLHQSAITIGKLGSVFHDLHSRTRKWPWPFGLLSGPFWDGYVRCYEMAHWLYTADRRIESLGWDEFRWSAGAWLLVRLGADIGRAEYYRHAPWAWMIWKFRREHLLLDALLNWDLWWIRDYVNSRWPVLWEISHNPQHWVWSKIVDRWPNVAEIVNHPVPWVLMRLGAHPWWAYYYEHNPWGWFIQRLHTQFPFLRTLYTDPEWQIWEWFEGAVDRFIEARIEWVISTCGRVISKIWETRIY